MRNYYPHYKFLSVCHLVILFHHRNSIIDHFQTNHKAVATIIIIMKVFGMVNFTIVINYKAIIAAIKLINFLKIKARSFWTLPKCFLSSN